MFNFSRAEVIVTDLPDFVPLMQLNIDSNSKVLKGKISCQALTWGSDVKDGKFPKLDLILVADCVYYEEVNLVLNLIL